MNLKNITKETITKDFYKLQKLNYNFTSPFSRVGNKIVDYFTFQERLKTKGNKGISFVEFLENIDKYTGRKSYKTFLEYEGNKNRSLLTNQYDFFRLYFGSIAIFKPLNAIMVYDRYKPKTVLDFTAGWGGRLVACCATNINYIGIDNNMNLKEPYQNMTKFLHQYSTSDIQLFFEDCLTVDYSKMDYDMVLTSPPYYDIEIYGEKSPFNSKEEWNEQFYIPIITTTYKYLKVGGYYCLNVPIEIYDQICVPLLGESNEKIPLPIVKRKNSSKYQEFIYVWIK
jgi:hypothetical protein